jgi:hypothetical protein
MPATFDHEFSIWLTQHGNERAAAVNVLEFKHPKWGSVFVNDFGEQFAGSTEAPVVSFVAEPLGFTIDVSADNASTEQRVMLRLDNVNGLVAQQLRSLDDDDLQTPVQVIYRAYLNTHRTVPAVDPLSLFVTSATLTRQLVELEATADMLPNVAAGVRYTVENFPALAFL